MPTQVGSLARSSLPGAPVPLTRRPSVLAFAALAVLVAVSFGLRLPRLDRPLSEPHDWITAQSLIALDILDAEGLARHSFAIPQTYPGTANRYVRNAGIRLFDTAGVGYYTSFPPLSIVVPHLVFRLLGGPPTLTGLRLYSLVLHGIAAVFVLALLRAMGRGHAGREAGALAGAAVFLFLAPNLWYLFSTYSWDTFWHFLWAPWLVLALDLLESDRPSHPGRLALLGGLTFALVYSEFIGALCAATLAGLLIIRGMRRHRWALGVLAAAVAAPLVLTLVQYSFLAGPGALRDALVYAFGERSFLMASPKSRPQMIELGSASPLVLIARTYLRWFGPLLTVVVAGGAIVALAGRRASSACRRVVSGEWALIVLTAAPILVHHAVLVQWTARHAYSVVKTSFLLAVLTAMVFRRLFDPGCARRWTAGAAGALLLVVLAHGIRGYRKDFTSAGDPSRFARLGAEIARQAGDGEVVFAVSRFTVNPQVVYYARRNIQTVASQEEATAWLVEHDRSSGILFEIDRTPRLVSAVGIRR